MSLYPLKFTPILKERIWGGEKLHTVLGKNPDRHPNIGESWELSTVPQNISVICNGELQGTVLTDLIKKYQHELVGEKVYEQFGEEFPLLIKLIDADEDLSIQVHPDDELAAKKHGSFGKTEMWYVLDDSQKPKLVNGFSRNTSREEVKSKLADNSLTELFKIDTVKKGDVAFIPSGRIHAICKGNLVAEIQQTSDITYRIYDYDRADKNGNKRELHIEDGLDALEYSEVSNSIIHTQGANNDVTEIIKCKYFTCNLVQVNSITEKDYNSIDSFIILIGVEGEMTINVPGSEHLFLKTGETVLLPASLNHISLSSETKSAKFLEVFL